MSDDGVPTVFARVHAVLSELPAIGKNSSAPAAMGGYKFRGIEDITAEMKPLLAKHGVFYAPKTLDRIDTVRATSGGKALYTTDVHVAFHFYDLDGNTFSADVWGQGSDSGDKAVSKAYTSALKTMLSPTFCISDQETDTERHDVPESEAAPIKRSGPETASPPAPSSGSYLTAADINSMTGLQLMDALRERGLQLGGTVLEMRSRLAGA